MDLEIDCWGHVTVERLQSILRVAPSRGSGNSLWRSPPPLTASSPTLNCRALCIVLCDLFLQKICFLINTPYTTRTLGVLLPLFFHDDMGSTSKPLSSKRHRFTDLFTYSFSLMIVLGFVFCFLFHSSSSSSSSSCVFYPPSIL